MGKNKNSGVNDNKKEEGKMSDLFTVITEEELAQKKDAPEEEVKIDDIDEDLLKSILASENNVGDTKEEIDTELLNSILADDSLITAEESLIADSSDISTEEAEESDETEEEESEADESDEAEETQIETLSDDETGFVETERKREHSSTDSESVTVITKGTTLNGSITSDCSLDVMGTINGDIECLGKLTISGKVTGNAMASEVFINTDRFEGNVTSEGCVKIGIETIVIGNLNATSAVIAGAVKGDIDVNGTVVIDSTAIIKGNVKAKSVQMNNGAVLEGFCSLAYATLDIDKIFE